MESNKYYTPEIEELYVGLECEHTSNMTAFKINDTDRIYKEELNQTDLCNYLNWEIEEGGLEKFIRVKYLDKEDIESLGFKFKTDLYVKDNLTLQVHKDSITIKYYDNFNKEWRTCVEQIIIKNKSELKKLMKQLNINDAK